MKIKLLTAAVISAATLLNPGIARADWVDVAHARNGAFLRVDESSLARYGDKVVYVEYVENTQDGVTMRVVADCQTGVYQPLEIIANGVRTYPPSGKMPVLQAPRGSLRSAAIDFACSSH
jgi:hypothetical protein